MKTMTSSRGGYRSVRSVLRSAVALGAASTLLATGMMFVAASPASAATPPTVNTVSPNAGPTTGNTTVTITGGGFQATGATYTVDFGGIPATSVSVTSNTVITAVSPPGTGTVHVTVIATDTGGPATSAASAADYFAYGAPTVTAVNPNAGPTLGSTSVTITGTGFVVGTTTVAFGGNAATAVTVNSPTSITATSPAGAGPGTVDVKVKNPEGTSATSVADHFTYVGPTVTAVSPNVGPTTGGTSVTITGTGFVVGTTTVAFGGNSATHVVVNSSTSITAVSPAGTGTVDVTVTVSGSGTSATNLADHFTYGGPTVTAVSPNVGPTTGGTSVTITGSGFVPGFTTVAFGGYAATAVTVVSPTSITAVSPAGTGTVDVTVTVSGSGTSATSALDHFTYGGPTVTAVSPNVGPTTGGTSVTITGSGFVPGFTTVAFGLNKSASATVNSPTSITAISPAGTGTVDVTVTVSGSGTSATSVADHFTYGGPALIAQAPLSLNSTSGTAGTALSLTSSGGSGTGAVTYGITNVGTAGCWIAGGKLNATRAGTCTVTVFKAADATYLATNSPATTVTFQVAYRAVNVVGVVWIGRTSIVSINGTGFYNKPTVKSNAAGTNAVVIHDYGKKIVVRVKVVPGSPQGWHVFTITLANGRSTQVRYLAKVAPVILKASRVNGVVWVGRTSIITINGTGFYNKPTVKSNAAGISAVVIHDHGNQLVVRVRAFPGSPRGWHVFTIILANGRSCQVRYLAK